MLTVNQTSDRPFLSMTETSTAPMTVSQPATTLAIAGTSEPVILRYFATFNAGAFQSTGQLFAVDGVLHAPFEDAIVGRDAIVAYLAAEAQGFRLQPRQGTTQRMDDGCTAVQIVGKVQTPLFAVNVSWRFILTPDQELRSATIKLLASPQELLSLRR